MASRPIVVRNDEVLPVWGNEYLMSPVVVWNGPNWIAGFVIAIFVVLPIPRINTDKNEPAECVVLLLFILLVIFFLILIFIQLFISAGNRGTCSSLAAGR